MRNAATRDLSRQPAFGDIAFTILPVTNLFPSEPNQQAKGGQVDDKGQKQKQGWTGSSGREKVTWPGCCERTAGRVEGEVREVITAQVWRHFQLERQKVPKDRQRVRKWNKTQTKLKNHAT